MSTLQRAGIAAGIFISTFLVATWWLYFIPTVDPLVAEFSGPFNDAYQLFKWAVPTTILIIDLLAGGYLVFGGIQEEKARERRIRGR
jgi:hypothetical protein